MKATVQCFSDPAAFDRLRAEWTELDERLSPRTPFSSPLWHETWWSHLRRNVWHARDDLVIYVVRDAGGRLIAVAPFMQTRRPGFGPARMIELHALGSDPHVTELRSVVCEPADQAVVMQALRDHIGATQPRPTWITWHNVRWREEAEWQPPGAMLADHYIWMRPQPAYLVDIPDTWSAFEATLTKRVRKKIRHSKNQLSRDGHSIALHVVSDPDEVIRAIHTFYDLVAVRSEVRHANPFNASSIREFFDDYAVRSARKGKLRLFELRNGEDVVASRIGFALGKDLYLYHSGNLPAWDRYSIMTTLLTEIFRWAIENGFTLVNLSSGLDRSKARWRPREIMYADAVEIMPGKINSVAYQAYHRLKARHAPAD